MDDSVKPLDFVESEPKEVNPWVDIWVSPRITIEWVLKNSSPAIAWLLIYMGGVHYGVERAWSNGWSGDVADLLQRAIFFSGIGGLFTYTIMIGTIQFVSTWFGGNGSFSKTATAFGWSMVPAVVSLVLTLIAYLFFGDDMFTADKSEINANDGLLYAHWVLVFLQVALRIWFFIVLIATIAQVQKFSIGRSVATVVCAFLFIIALLVAFVLMVGGNLNFNFNF